MEEMRIKKYNFIPNSSHLEKFSIIAVRAFSLFCSQGIILKQRCRDVSGCWYKQDPENYKKPDNLLLGPPLWLPSRQRLRNIYLLHVSLFWYLFSKRYYLFISFSFLLKCFKMKQMWISIAHILWFLCFY